MAVARDEQATQAVTSKAKPSRRAHLRSQLDGGSTTACGIGPSYKGVVLCIEAFLAWPGDRCERCAEVVAATKRGRK